MTDTVGGVPPRSVSSIDKDSGTLTPKPVGRGVPAEGLSGHLFLRGGLEIGCWLLCNT